MCENNMSGDANLGPWPNDVELPIEVADTNKLRSEHAEVCTQRLICLQKAILSNPELMKGIGTRNNFRASGMAVDVFYMSEVLYKKSVEFAKSK